MPLDMGPNYTDIPPSVSHIWWLRLETCSNLFTLGPSLPPALTSGGIEEASTAVCILLECFLVCLLSVPRD